MTETTDMPPTLAKARPKRENIWLSLLFNIAVPTLILSKLSAEHRLGPVGALLTGLAFPLTYGLYDLITRRKWNLFSMVGLVSVSLTGGLGLVAAAGIWFAVKEASVPLAFAVAVLVTVRTRRPLVRELLLNDAVTDVAKIEAALDARGTRPDFHQLMRRCTWGLAGSFLLSAVLNFVLARILLTASPGTAEFTAQLGYMNGLSFIVIVAPCLVVTGLVLWRLFAGLTRLTGLPFEALLHTPPPKNPPAPTATR